MTFDMKKNSDLRIMVNLNLFLSIDKEKNKEMFFQDKFQKRIHEGK